MGGIDAAEEFTTTFNKLKMWQKNVSNRIALLVLEFPKK